MQDTPGYLERGTELRRGQKELSQEINSEPDGFFAVFFGAQHGMLRGPFGKTGGIYDQRSISCRISECLFDLILGNGLGR